MKSKLFIFIAGAFLSAVSFFVLSNIFSGLFEDGILFDEKRTAVVREIRELSRLETASYTIEKVIDARTDKGAIRNFLFGDRILLIAHGEVIAGVDLSQVSEDDIRINGSEITIDLPPSKILLSRLDNEKTKVYDRSLGILSRGEEELESEARKQAEREIYDAACVEGVLETASENAEKQISALLRSLDFNPVSVQVPVGECS